MMVPKFRVWSKMLGKYRQLDETSNDQGLGMLFEVKDGIGSNVTSICYSVGDVVEQFTGLKDVNGNEIYEGDILAISYMIDEDKVTDYLKVEWREDYAGFYCGEKPLYACLSEWDNDIKLAQTYPKIFGNVHENPELLEEQK
ncbi:YopX family protein [Lactiplantibacillus plantarum]